MNSENSELGISAPLFSTLVEHVSSEATRRLVIVSGFKPATVKKDVEKLAGNAKNIRQVHYPVVLDSHKKSRSAAILYRGKRDALKAVARLNSSKFEGSLLSASMYGKKPENVKQGRLIVRNLSFKCGTESLAEEFRRFGEVIEVSIPVQGDGKKKGFGIVQFKSQLHAAEAIQHLNGTNFHGRPIAVDWMVAKDRYLKAVEAEEAIEKDDEDIDVHDDVEEKDSDAMDVDECEDGNSDINDDDDGDYDNVDDDDDDDDDDDEEGNGCKISSSKFTEKKREVDRPARTTDVDEGLTVFIRNLSFDSSQEDLEDLMSTFGDVAYCRLVVDQNTEHPKGTAFVKFKSKQSVDKCLQSAQVAGDGAADGLILDSRKLLVSLAVSRDKIQNITSVKKSSEKVDLRNLHLVREGLIRPGTQGSEGLSKSDIAKRLKVEALTRQKLKNPNIFVSTTRLCVRNIPTSVDDAGLKKIFLKAADNTHARITECRIMRDLSRTNALKVGKSRGYAFVNFSNHTDALQALRRTNNVPDVFGEKKRLIVEFSLENRSALLAKEKRAERIMVKKSMFSTAKPVRLAPKTKLKVDTVPGPPGKQKGSLVLPSHSGAKIRHKSRGASVKDSKVLKGAKVSKEPKKKKKNGRKCKNLEVRDSVDHLVAKYRQKITDFAGASNRWSF